MEMWKKLFFSDFSSICRLCLSRDDLEYFFKYPALISIYNVITNLKMKEDDSLPKNVCGPCLKKIQHIEVFVDMCKANHEILAAIALHEEDKIRTTKSILGNVFVEHNSSDNEDTEINEVEVVHESDNDKSELIDGFGENKAISAEGIRSRDNTKKGLNKTKILACKYCGKNVPVNRLNIHLRTHSGLKPCKCDKCFRRFASKDALQRHKIVHCSVRPFKCNICEWSGRTFAELEKHEGKHSSPNNCRLSQKNATSQMPIEKKWKCLHCTKSFTRKFDLQLHLRIHSGFKPHKCTLCEKNFTQKHTLLRHINSVHVTNTEKKYNFQCYICDRKFVRKDNLEAHLLNVHIKKQGSIENDSGSTACIICKKDFGHNAYLVQHINVVHECDPEQKKSKTEKPKFRNTRFKTTSNLCPFCGISFEKRKSFHQHMNRKHSNKDRKPKAENKPKQKREHQCWHCGKIINSLCNLKTHVRIHTGEKPYECKYCQLRFAAWNSWREHENIHTGAKPYQCELCKKGFRHRSGLRKHMKSSIHNK